MKSRMYTPNGYFAIAFITKINGNFRKSMLDFITEGEWISMTREDYIKALIKSHGYTLKDFARQIHMPYTTLLSILNGSIGGAAMDNVLKICHALNIRIEDLDHISEQLDPNHEFAETDSGIDEQLLNLIRALPSEKQIALKILLTAK